MVYKITGGKARTAAPAGFTRTPIPRDGLREAISALAAVGHSQPPNPARLDFEVRNMHGVATLIAHCALAREESRGGHYRLDFPEKRLEFQKHSMVTRDRDGVRFE